MKPNHFSVKQLGIRIKATQRVRQLITEGNMNEQITSFEITESGLMHAIRQIFLQS